MNRKRKLAILLISLLLMITMIVACSSQEKEIDYDSLQEFTLDELAEFNGKDGNAAYIAVDGVIYDVTDISQWKNGLHNGFDAGQDLTEAIKNQSPHGISKLKNLKVVGKLID